MAYQDVGSCIFYVDILSWLKSLGLINWGFTTTGTSIDTSEMDIIGINPSSITTITPDPDAHSFSVNYQIDDSIDGLGSIMYENQNFRMLLGHNHYSSSFYHTLNPTFGVDNYGLAPDNYVNMFQPYYASQNGFSIARGNNVLDLTDPNSVVFYFKSADPDNPSFGALIDLGWTDGFFKIGSYLYGNYFIMPHSPDLRLTKNVEMDGVKKIRTKGGADLVNHQYTKAPMWGDMAPWEIADGNSLDHRYARHGKRSWDLSFNYLQDSSLFPEMLALTRLEEVGYDYDSYKSQVFDNTLLNDNNFFSQVIHKTNGGQLPFVFQPDGRNPDGFAICKMNEFQFEQVANGVYNMKLKIREVW